jgi:putative transposase
VLAHEFPIRPICRVLAVASSRFYYQPRVREEAGRKAALVRLAEEWPTFGRPRVTAMLTREGFRVNHKRVGRLMRELELCARPPARKRRTTDSRQAFERWPNVVGGVDIVRPDQVWVSDITYIHLRTEFVYLAVVMDVFTRAIRGWHLSRNLDGNLTLTALQRALQGHTPEIHHADQGVQYANHGYVGLLRSLGCRISMATVGEPTENCYAERLVRTIKEEPIALTEYEGYADAHRQLGRFLDDIYQHKRIHSALVVHHTDHKGSICVRVRRACAVVTRHATIA